MSHDTGATFHMQRDPGSASFDRQPQILDLLEQRRSCGVAELSSHFRVSGETIRRDIKALLQTGRVEKVHGGVRLREDPVEAAYLQRLKENKAGKQAIGARAAALVQDGMVVLIDSGTTSYYAARQMSARSRLSVITNSLEVAREMARSGRNRIYFAGGEINNAYLSAFGAETIEQARRFTPAIAFLSIGAIDLRLGALDYHLEEADFKRALAPLAKKVVLLADASKFGKGGLVRALDFDQFDVLVTDRPLSDDYAAALSNVDVLVT